MAESNKPTGRRRNARALAEKALEAEQLGEDDRANELIGEAERVDPEETMGYCRMEMDGNTIAKARVAVGGVATAPWPLPAVEKALAGQALNAETAVSAATHATQGARTYGGNAFKLKLLPRVVEQAILAAGGQP